MVIPCYFEFRQPKRRENIQVLLQQQILGTQINDLKAIDAHEDKRKIYVECQVCKRVRIQFIKRFREGSGTIHKDCGLFLNMRNTSFYGSWFNMRTRTTNPNSPKYKSYGERGINSEEFKYFVDFYDSMYESYLEHVKIHGKDNTTLERIDVNDHYSKSNCCWKTWNEQAQNKTTTLNFIATDPNGITYKDRNLKEFCLKHNLRYDTVITGIHMNYKKQKSGWHFEIV